MRSLRPELMVCAYHQAVQRRAVRDLNRWSGFVAYARDPLPTETDEVFPSSPHNLFSSSRRHQLVTPEDVLPGFEVGLIEQVEQTDFDTARTKKVETFKPQGRVIAVFHDYSRTQPVIFANALGEVTGYLSHLPVAVQQDALHPQRCPFDCSTERVVAGLLWLLGSLLGTPMPDPVHPGYIEDAVPIALIWNLIWREQHDGQYKTPRLTDAGRIWLLAHYRAMGEELDVSTAPKRSIQNIFDNRGASGPMNFNLNQGNTGQGNVNFGSQGNVTQGSHASVTSVTSTVSTQDYHSIGQILDTIHRHSAELRLSPEQWYQLTEAAQHLREALGHGKLDQPKSRTASQTILKLARDTLTKVAPEVAMAALEKLAGLG